MPRWPGKGEEAEAKKVSGLNKMVGFTTTKELPECKTRVNKQGVKMFAKYGEPRYLLQRIDGGFSFRKIYKKVNSVVTRGIIVYKRKLPKHMKEVQRLKAAGIPIIGD